MSLPVSREVIVLSNAFQLVPVVEFEAAAYKREGRDSPLGPPLELREDWQRYWEQSLADSGIHGLVPVEPASMLVPVSQLTEPHVLRALLRLALNPYGEEDAQTRDVDPNELIALSGGLALLDGGRVLLLPGCCADLENLNSWEAAARQQCDTFWMGHPEVSAHWESPWLVLRDAPSSSGESPHEWRLEPLSLQQALREARTAQEEFARRLEPFVAERCPTESVQSIVALLTGLS